MGVINRQTIKSVIYTYAGTVLGFITVGILFPIYLTTSEIGALNLVNRWSMMIMQIGTLGFPVAMIKYFPYYKNKEKKHHGFLFISLIIGVIGFLITTGILLIFNDAIIENENEKSPLFSQYFNYIYLVTFFYLFFYILDTYSKAIYQSSASVLLREFVQRIIIIVLTGAFIGKLIGFDDYAILYFITICTPTLFLFMFLWVKKEIHLTPNFEIFRSEHKNSIIKRSAFGLISGLGISGLLSIDVIMLNEYLGESSAGVYTTVFYFAALILIPFRAFGRLAGNLIAEAIKENDHKRLKKVYYNSCLTQFIIGTILLALMLVNMDNIFTFLKPEFKAAYYVILIVGAGNLFEMATGFNHSIIDYSKYYRFGAYFVGLLIICTIVFNMIFIPIMEINGAAVGTALSLIVFNLVKTIFVYRKYKLWPFNMNFIWVLLLATILISVVWIIPNVSNIYFNMLFKSSLLFFPLFGVIYLAKFSTEFNKNVHNFLTLLKRKDHDKK